MSSTNQPKGKSAKTDEPENVAGEKNANEEVLSTGGIESKMTMTPVGDEANTYRVNISFEFTMSLDPEAPKGMKQILVEAAGKTFASDRGGRSAPGPKVVVSAPIREAFACNKCREKRRTCDSVRPTCALCIHGKLQCFYSPASRSQRGKIIVPAVSKTFDAAGDEIVAGDSSDEADEAAGRRSSWTCQRRCCWENPRCIIFLNIG